MKEKYVTPGSFSSFSHCIALQVFPHNKKQNKTKQRSDHKTKHLNIIFLRHVIGRYSVTKDIYMDFM